MDGLLALTVEAPDGEAVDAALRAEVRRFLAIGGVITLSDWLALDERTRCAVEAELSEAAGDVAAQEISAAVDVVVERMRGGV